MHLLNIAPLFIILVAVYDVRALNCTVNAKGNGDDDAPNLISAVRECGKDGSITLPSKNYTIAQPITTHLENSSLDIHGYLSFTPNISYWVANSYRFPFQNQSIAWFVVYVDFE